MNHPTCRQDAGDSNLTSEQLADYALGLLPDEQAQKIAQHVGQCPACRAQLARERALGRLVRQTLAVQPQPSAARLAQLQPPAPRRLRSVVVYRHATLQRSVAVFGLLLFLLLGNLGWHGASRAYASPEPIVALATPAPTERATLIVHAVPPATRAPANRSLNSPGTPTNPNAPAAIPAPVVTKQ